MSTTQDRLRQAARFTRLDADRELLTEAADALDRREAVIRLLEGEVALAVPGVPDDVVRDAERWRIANLTAETALKHPDHRTSEESVAFNAYRCAVENGLNFEAAIDAAMLAAKEASA